MTRHRPSLHRSIRYHIGLVYRPWGDESGLELSDNRPTFHAKVEKPGSITRNTERVSTTVVDSTTGSAGVGGI